MALHWAAGSLQELEVRAAQQSSLKWYWSVAHAAGFQKTKDICICLSVYPVDVMSSP